MVVVSESIREEFISKAEGGATMIPPPYYSIAQHVDNKQNTKSLRDDKLQLNLKECHLFEALNAETELSIGRNPTVAFLQLRWSVPWDVVAGRQMSSSS